MNNHNNNHQQNDDSPPRDAPSWFKEKFGTSPPQQDDHDEDDDDDQRETIPSPPSRAAAGAPVMANDDASVSSNINNSPRFRLFHDVMGLQVSNPGDDDDDDDDSSHPKTPPKNRSAVRSSTGSQPRIRAIMNRSGGGGAPKDRFNYSGCMKAFQDQVAKGGSSSSDESMDDGDDEEEDVESHSYNQQHGYEHRMRQLRINRGVGGEYYNNNGPSDDDDDDDDEAESYYSASANAMRECGTCTEYYRAILPYCPRCQQNKNSLGRSHQAPPPVAGPPPHHATGGYPGFGQGQPLNFSPASRGRAFAPSPGNHGMRSAKKAPPSGAGFGQGGPPVPSPSARQGLASAPSPGHRSAKKESTSRAAVSGQGGQVLPPWVRQPFVVPPSHQGKPRASGPRVASGPGGPKVLSTRTRQSLGFDPAAGSGPGGQPLLPPPVRRSHPFGPGSPDQGCNRRDSGPPRQVARRRPAEDDGLGELRSAFPVAPFDAPTPKRRKLAANVKRGASLSNHNRQTAEKLVDEYGDDAMEYEMTMQQQQQQQEQRQLVLLNNHHQQQRQEEDDHISNNQEQVTKKKSGIQFIGKTDFNNCKINSFVVNNSGSQPRSPDA